MSRPALVPLLCILTTFACCCYTPAVRSRRTGPATAAGAQPVIRVRLLSAGSPARVSSEAGLLVEAGSRTTRVEAGQPAELTIENGRAVRTGVRTWSAVSDTVFLRTPGTFVNVGSRRYRGSLLAFVDATGELAVVNELGLEDYLYGVVPCEIGPISTETFEAVKAQAVAARSFTLTRLTKRRGLGFQLYDSYARDQEYQGAGRETALGNRAVDETRGEVLLYHGEPAEALYHANCGGVTANGSQPYLKSIADTPGGRRRTPYCAGSKHSSWRTGFSREDFENRLGTLLGVDGRVEVRSYGVETDNSGRASHLRFKTRKGSYRISGSDFRLGLGLKSTLFKMEMGRNSVVFTGKGWGHGSGLCQDGAIEMARRGSNHREILLHYYSGVKLGRRY